MGPPNRPVVKKEVSIKALHLFIFIAGGLLVMLLLGISTESWNINLFFNSDTLYLPSIYLDLFVHGSGLKGWHLNSSPNFFPDMIAYMGMMAILKKTALTSFVFSIVQFLSVMFLMYHAFKSWSPATSREVHILLGTVLLLFLAGPVTGEDPLIIFQLLVPSYHCGFFINSLLAMIVARNYLSTGKTGALLITGLLSILASLSDRLFLIAFTFPLLVLMALVIIRDHREYRNYKLLAVTLAGSFLGMWFFGKLYNGSLLHFIATDWKMFNFSNIVPSFHHLTGYLVSIIRDEPVQRWMIILMLAFMLSAPFYLLWYLGAFIRKRMEEKETCSYMLIFFLWIQVVGVLLTPVINGNFLGPAHIRYSFPALLLGPVGALYLISIHLEKFGQFRVTTHIMAHLLPAVLLLLIIVTGTKHHTLKSIGVYVNYYPEESEILDSLKEKHNLTYGIASYWHAKHATIFSRKGIRVYSIFNQNLKPFYHVTNENWYHDGGKGRYANPVFNFLYTEEDFSRKLLVEHFGRQLDTVYSGEGVAVIKLPPFKFDRETREIILLDSLVLTGNN